MYIQLKFKSFYKLTLDKKNIYLKTPAKLKILSTDMTTLFSIVMFLFFINTEKQQLYQRKRYSMYYFTFFNLPTKNSSTIFLRAPYKNKLARLNIVRFEYSSIFSIKRKLLNIYILHLIDLNSLILLFSQYNLSSYRVKHAHTKFFLDICMPSNFLFNNYI